MTIKNIFEMGQFDDAHLTKQTLFEEGQSRAFILNFLPGQSLPEHAHPNTQVYLLVSKGTGTCSIDGAVMTVSDGDAIHCSKDEKLSISNTGDRPLTVYVVLAREKM